MAFHREHAHSPTARRASRRGGHVDYQLHGEEEEEEGDRLLAAGQVGMQLKWCRYANERVKGDPGTVKEVKKGGHS